jgi:hypothetical protein
MEYVICPICAQRINLTARKDWESFALREYQEHVAAFHKTGSDFGIPYAIVMSDPVKTPAKRRKTIKKTK